MGETVTKEYEVEIATKTRTKVSVTFPLYKKHDLMLDQVDSIAYRRVDKDLNEVSVQVTDRYRDGAKQYELELDKAQIDGSDYSLGKGQYACTEEEFFSALQKLREAVEQVWNERNQS